MGLALNIFQILFCGSVKTNFNLRDNLKLLPNNITMLDNIIASIFNDIPLHIRSSLNVELFKTHCKRFYSTFGGLIIASFFLERVSSFFLANFEKYFLSSEIYASKRIYISRPKLYLTFDL